MPTAFETIKARVRDVIDELREPGNERRGRVTVRTTRTSNAKAGKGLDALGRAYRLLDELKTLVGDLDRVAGEVKGFLPAKKRAPSARKRASSAKKRAPKGRRSPRGSLVKARSAGRRRGRRTSGSIRTERTTILSESPRRHAPIAG
jgi:hypothetical protein